MLKASTLLQLVIFYSRHTLSIYNYPFIASFVLYFYKNRFLLKCIEHINYPDIASFVFCLYQNWVFDEMILILLNFLLVYDVG